MSPTLTCAVLFVAGENDGIPMISNTKIREEQRMTTTNPWMLPSDKVWPKEHVFISTPTFNYTHQDYRRLFTNIDYEDGWYLHSNNSTSLTQLMQPV